MRTFALFTILAALVSASPTPHTNKGNGRKTCVVAHANGGDDTPNVHKAVAECSKNAVIHFAPGID